MREIGRVNWVICPNCKYRYYVGASLLMVKGVPAICPKCRHEFESQEHQELEIKDRRAFS